MVFFVCLFVLVFLRKPHGNQKAKIYSEYTKDREKESNHTNTENHQFIKEEQEKKRIKK